MPTALITGITGQDGSYLAELLLEKGYTVFGLIRRTSTSNVERISHLLNSTDRITLLSGDILDLNSLVKVLRESHPDEVYNLASMSSVAESFRHPTMTGQYTALSVSRILEAIMLEAPNARFFQASSSEMFGNDATAPQNELSHFHPCSPYGIAKLYGHWMTIHFRNSYNLFACSGILFNHESPRRGFEFVTRRISLGVARIKLGLQKQLTLGNIDAKRDWGFAAEYVDAMWRMLNMQQQPDDFVIATGTPHSVKDFVRIAFAYVGIDDWERFVSIDKKLLRPLDINYLGGDASKARDKLGWSPVCTFEELVNMMVENDLERTKLEIQHHY